MKTPTRLARAVAAFFLLLLTCAIPLNAIDSAPARKLFAHPTREYSTGPLWVWNDMLTEGEIRETMRDLAGQQVKQVFVHPRPGLMTPYLSKDWFRLWKVALDEAARLDMNVWIYDENSYPSGFAGGWVPEVMPEARGRGLQFRELPTAPAPGGDFLGVYRVGGDRFENVTAKVKRGETLPSARYLAVTEQRSQNSPWHGNRCYVNLLSPGVTEKFLELTLEPYRREIGRAFGKRVPGVFTDEPNIRPAGGYPWSEVLAREFQVRWGYSLLDHLPSLAHPIGDWRRIRHNYWQVLNEQFIEHWSRPYHDYCATNHLEWTGHYWDHEWPNCMGVPDNMAMYAWHQRPAIDCLMNQYQENTHAQFGNVRMVKELSSVANQLGLNRTLCEVYGAGGWDLRLEDMKRIGDWLEVLGVNTLDQHLSYVTLRGARKRDHPQSFSYHEPWWKAYHVSASYFDRVSAALSQGDQVNRILVLEPTTTAWMYQGEDTSLKEIGDAFFHLVMSLEAAQIEYDLGCEDVIARHGSVRGKELQVGQRRYHTIVLPPLSDPARPQVPPLEGNLNRATRALLEEFVTAGGSLITSGRWFALVDGSAPARESAAVSQSAQVRQTDPAGIAGLLLASDQADGFRLTPGAQKGILFHHRRRLGDGQLLFLVNSSLESDSSGVIESELKGVEKWNLETGATEPFPFETAANGLKAGFRLPPCGSLLLFLSKAPMKAAPLLISQTRVISADSKLEIRRLEPNVLTLDYVDITAGGETKSNQYFYQAGQFAFQKNGLDRNPWDSAVQFKNELITKTFSPGSGFEAIYRFAIERIVPKNLAIVIERPDLYKIECNGKPVSARSGDWWLDKAFGRIDIAPVAKVGENTVTIKASPFTIYHEIEPAYLLGDFSLRPDVKGFVVIPDQPLQPGKWDDQGQPFYSGGVGYRERFAVEKPAGRYVVSLPSWLGSVARVAVNGKPAGYISAPPWSCDVTKEIRRGLNTIEVVAIGTLKNTLGPHHGKPGLGSAWPGMFQHGPNPGPPPGKDYHTVGYGLFQPFTLTQMVPQQSAGQSARLGRSE